MCAIQVLECAAEFQLIRRRQLFRKGKECSFIFPYNELFLTAKYLFTREQRQLKCMEYVRRSLCRVHSHCYLIIYTYQSIAPGRTCYVLYIQDHSLTFLKHAPTIFLLSYSIASFLLLFALFVFFRATLPGVLNCSFGQRQAPDRQRQSAA